MGFKTITGIQWTNLELRGLLEDEDSCVYLEKIQKHLGLHPFHLTNLNEALREILNASLNFYDPEYVKEFIFKLNCFKNLNKKYKCK
jgi:hypothetical protein